MPQHCEIVCAVARARPEAAGNKGGHAGTAAYVIERERKARVGDLRLPRRLASLSALSSLHGEKRTGQRSKTPARCRLVKGGQTPISAPRY